MSDVITWVGIAVSAGIGIFGVVFAGVANSRAKKANQLAAEANRHAEAAVTEAVEANRVAVAANELSEEANSVIKTQAAQSIEHWLTEWRVEWEPKESALIFTNDGRDAAIDPTIIVNGDVLRDTWVGSEPVARDEDIRLEFPHVAEHRRDTNHELTQEWERALSAGVFGTPVSWSEQVMVIIAWKSGLGKPHEERFQIEIS